MCDPGMEGNCKCKASLGSMTGPWQDKKKWKEKERRKEKEGKERKQGNKEV